MSLNGHPWLKKKNQFRNKLLIIAEEIKTSEIAAIELFHATQIKLPSLRSHS